MINNLIIQNFQSHKRSELSFSKGVNIITGSSDSGKSAILRALRWLIWNRPTGDEFRSDWGGDTHVMISIDNKEIERQKTNSNNSYLIGNVKRFEKALELKAIGTEVPKEVKELLNLNEINLQQQLDSPFLLSQTPGEVAQHFNRVSHLNQIDLGLRNVQKWIREIEQDIQAKKKQSADFSEKLQQYDHLDKFEIELEVFEDLQVKKLQQINAKNELIELIDEINEVEGQIKEHEEILKVEPLLNKILGWIEEKEAKEKQRRSLRKLINEIKENETALSLKTIEAARLEKEFKESFPNICPLCGSKIKKI